VSGPIIIIIIIIIIITDEIAVILLLELCFTAYSKIVFKSLDDFGKFMVGECDSHQCEEFLRVVY
jgi:hypothetical protein